MTYAHQGPATVTMTIRCVGDESVTIVNEAVQIELGGTGQLGQAAVVFIGELQSPAHANYVSVDLLNGLILDGAILRHQDNAHGGWLTTFNVDKVILGLLL